MAKRNAADILLVKSSIGFRMCATAKAKAPALKDRSLSRTASAILSPGIAASFSTCINTTKEKIIEPSKVAANVEHLSTTMLRAAAIRAVPTKYVQNRWPGIQEGTMDATICGAM